MAHDKMADPEMWYVYFNMNLKTNLVKLNFTFEPIDNHDMCYNHLHSASKVFILGWCLDVMFGLN